MIDFLVTTTHLYKVSVSKVSSEMVVYKLCCGSTFKACSVKNMMRRHHGHISDTISAASWMQEKIFTTCAHTCATAVNSIASALELISVHFQLDTVGLYSTSCIVQRMRSPDKTFSCV